ncbi:MAG: 30S ribosomal protein S20 [Pseudomonadota bacterium]
MANSPQAKKRVRQAEKNRERNKALRSKVRTAIKKVDAAIKAKDAEQAQAAYKQAVPVIDSMVNKGIFQQNKAARHKSRLNSKVKVL